jgi:hypothetical protein
METTLEQANEALAREGYPPIKRLPADPAAIAAWRRIVDARRELDSTGKLSETTLLAISQFCHCLKCPSYPRGEMPVYCLRGKSAHEIAPMNCKCPSCAVYKIGEMQTTDYFCMTGAPGKRLIRLGGAVGVARRFLDHEVEEGNPGKRLPERLMSVPQLAGLRPDGVETPEKVPGWD